jgi:nitroimidazol reductase NimA-like FMN-containing flavoprotein (pyridoxamine 5'-phosphate oxidase superfamily)
MPLPELTKTDATTVRRKAERADYRRDSANAILDEALIAHVGFSVDEQPFVIPMVFGRDGERLILHGSVASRLLRALDDGVPVCITVTLIDALVASRSQFHTSMNYRSVVIIGIAQRIRDLDDARRAMACVVDHALPGRSAEARPPTDAELRQTAVLELPIDTASVKTRTGGPIEDPDDLALPVWGGIVPVATAFGVPQPDADVRADVRVPAVLAEYRRPGS